MIESSTVIDASFVLKVVLVNPQQGRYIALTDRWIDQGRQLLAPSLWVYETTSSLCKSLHFEQITLDECSKALRDASTLGIRSIPPDDDQTSRALRWTVQLRRAAAYDSYYLALAEILGCDLWTADRRLFNAVNLPWVRTVGADE